VGKQKQKNALALLQLPPSVVATCVIVACYSLLFARRRASRYNLQLGLFPLPRLSFVTVLRTGARVFVGAAYAF